MLDDLVDVNLAIIFIIVRPHSMGFRLLFLVVIIFHSCSMGFGIWSIAAATPYRSWEATDCNMIGAGKTKMNSPDAYFFPPFQPSLLPKTKGGPVISRQLLPRQARIIVYNKRSNETSVWTVELLEVHAAARGGHHRGKVISSKVIEDVQPPMDAMEYVDCESVVKYYRPFREAMKKRGINDKDLEVADETFKSICTVAELASHCNAREPYQQRDMGHALNVLSLLVERWKPSDPDDEDCYGIDLDMTLPHMVALCSGIISTSGTGLKQV